MTTFFVIDVETTGLNPFNRKHQLAAVGAVAVTADGLISDWWYEALRFSTWDEVTKEWWSQQNETARAEMRPKLGGDPKIVAVEFVEWVQEQDTDNVFVANPSTFDYAWVLRWLTEAGLDMPFSHRTLCLRSADWGRTGGQWGLDRTGHRPVVPHHALHDAQAQAFDLIDIIGSHNRSEIKRESGA